MSHHNLLPIVKKTIAVVLTVSTLSALGCSQGSGNGDLLLPGSSPNSLDPVQCTQASSAQYLVEIFSGLVTLDSDLNVVGDIAQSWELSSDGMTYTFHIRGGVRFHDGREVTAEDFKYSIERAAAPETGSPVAEAYLGDIVGVKDKLDGLTDEVGGVRVVDGETLEITIDAPKAYFLSKLTHPSTFVVDRQNVESGEDWWERPNGTGPFKLTEWTEGERIVLERNGYYYRGVAKLESVTYLLRGNSMMMYENDEIHITSVGGANIERVLDPANPLNRELANTSELSTFYVGFNVETPPFDDAKVRQAFCHAVEREKLIEVIGQGTVIPAERILPPGMPGYNDDLEGLNYNVTLAQQLIAESSYSDGLPAVVLSCMGDCSGVSAVNSALAWMWQENLGANVSVQCVESDTFLDDLIGRELQMFEIGWIADYPDPENFLDILFHSESVENHTGYNNTEVDELLEEARIESGIDSRLALYQDIEQLIVDDAPWLPLYHGQSYYLVKPEVKGFEPAPMVIPQFKDVWTQR